jgi:hypothetical protein
MAKTLKNVVRDAFCVVRSNPSATASQGLDAPRTTHHAPHSYLSIPAICSRTAWTAAPSNSAIPWAIAAA